MFREGAKSSFRESRLGVYFFIFGADVLEGDEVVEVGGLFRMFVSL